MKKYFILLNLLALLYTGVRSQTANTDFIPGNRIFFEDRFDPDAVGDLPAKWSANGDGTIVELSRPKGKWFKIMSPTAVNPELDEPLPEHCTIEFDLLMRKATGPAPHIMFGLTTISDVSAADIYRSNIYVRIERYEEISFGKNINHLGSKSVPLLSSYIERPLHISIAINGPRFRVYFANQKVVDLPKLVTPDFRGNFFVACSPFVPGSDEGVYIRNIRMAAGDADVRSVLIKQLLEQGNVTTNQINFDNQGKTLSTESLPVLNELGTVLEQNPTMNIAVNGVEETDPGLVSNPTEVAADSSAVMNPQVIDANSAIKEALKQKADKIKAYLLDKFKIEANRIITGAKVKVNQEVEKNKTLQKAKGFLTEIIKL